MDRWTNHGGISILKALVAVGSDELINVKNIVNKNRISNCNIIWKYCYSDSIEQEQISRYRKEKARRIEEKGPPFRARNDKVNKWVKGKATDFISSGRILMY